MEAGTPTSVQKLKNSSKRIKVNLASCKYPLLRMVLEHLDMEEVDDTCEDWNLLWTDSAPPISRILNLKEHQRCNHFMGMIEIARKDSLGRNLQNMQKHFPEDYDFFPRTYVLPTQYGDLRAQFSNSRKATYIVKPDASSQGRGIFLTRSLDDIDPMAHIIVQEYITKPVLVDGTKFDLRVYALVTCLDPLQIFLYKEGMARFATEKYIYPSHDNMVYMHLTNYSINKNSIKFVSDDPSGNTGFKRSISSVFQYLNDIGVNIQELWNNIAQIIVKTLLAIRPKLIHIYNTCFPNDLYGNVCFELLGFDIILKQTRNNIKPLLLEVNHAPSLNIDTKFDKELKTKLLQDVFKIINIKHQYKQHFKELITKDKNQKLLKQQKIKEYHIKNLSKELQRSIDTNFTCIISYDDLVFEKFLISIPQRETQTMKLQRIHKEKKNQQKTITTHKNKSRRKTVKNTITQEPQTYIHTKAVVHNATSANKLKQSINLQYGKLITTEITPFFSIG